VSNHPGVQTTHPRVQGTTQRSTGGGQGSRGTHGEDPLSVEQAKASPPSKRDLVTKAKLTLLVPQNSTQHVMCVGVRPGQANAHQEKLYNLGDSAPGGHVGLIKLLQKWCESRHRVLVAVMFDGIKKEQNTVWTLLEESISKGKGTLTAGIDYYHQLKSNRNACVFIGTAPPAGGHCIVDISILLTHLPVEVVLMTNEYSDDLAAAAVSPAAFHAIAASSEPMWARYGTALFLLAMKTWQMAIDDRNRDSLARVRCWFIWFGLFVLTSFSLHTDTLRNNTAFALAALIVVCRECDSVTQPWRVTTRMQEGYHGEIRTASHMTEVSVAQLYDIVQSMNIVHANCRKNGWEAWRATASGSSISGAAARLLDLALPVQAAMSEEAIIEQGRSAAAHTKAQRPMTKDKWLDSITHARSHLAQPMASRKSCGIRDGSLSSSHSSMPSLVDVVPLAMAREDTGGSLSSSHSSMPSLVDVVPLTRSRSDPGFDEYSDEYRVAQREELRRARHTAKTV
jgi:hypothetical protein